MTQQNLVTEFAVVTVFLLLWAVIPLAIHPTFRKDRRQVLAFLAVMAAVSAATAALALTPQPAWAAIPFVGYLGLLAIWTTTAAVARARSIGVHHRARKALRAYNREQRELAG